MISGRLPAINRAISSGHYRTAEILLKQSIAEHPDFSTYRTKLAELRQARDQAAAPVHERVRDTASRAPMRDTSAGVRDTRETGRGTDCSGSVHSTGSARILLDRRDLKRMVTHPEFAGIASYNTNASIPPIQGGRRTRGDAKASRPGAPLVSIVTAVYNNAETLQRCLESVMAQTYKNVEHIIIDGGSNAETVDIIRRADSHLDYYSSEPDNGIYDAMNKGIRAAAGEYICLLNSDDYYDNRFVETLVTYAITNHSALVYCDYQHGNTKVESLPINDGIFFGHLNINHSTFLVHKLAYDFVGPYSTENKIVSDAIWMRKAYAARIRFDHVQGAMFTFAEDGLSSGNTDEHRKLFISEVVSSYRARFCFLDPSEAEQLYLLRFNARRLDAALEIVKRYADHVAFTHSVGNYIEYCMRCRPEFKLTSADYDDKLPAFVSACTHFSIDYSAIRIPTKRGWLADLLHDIDTTIALRKVSANKTILHFASVFSRPSETFIYDFLLYTERESFFDNFFLHDHQLLAAERPYKKALWIPWQDHHYAVQNILYERLFKTLDPDVIVCHFALNAWQLQKRLDVLGVTKPTVIMTHGIDVFSMVDEGDYRDFVLNKLACRDDVMFSAVSEYLQRRLVSYGVPESRVRVVPNAANSRFMAHRRKVWANVDGGLRTVKLLAVGRLIAWKGHAMLLDAFAKACREISRPLSLTIVYGGGDELLGELESHCRDLEIQDAVKFVPYVDFNANPDFHSHFDLFVHPSGYGPKPRERGETFGVAILEAIGAGLPVIVTDAGGVPEVVGEACKHASIVPHGNSAAFAAAIVSTIQNGALEDDNATFARSRFNEFSERRRLLGFAKLVYQSLGKRVNVAIFSTSTVQGAGYAAYRLHKSLLQTDTVAPTLFTTVRNHESEPGVMRIPHPTGDGSRWNRLQRGPISKPNLTIFTVNQQHLTNSDIDALLVGQDVVNLHWVARFLSVENIIHLTRGNRPVVMTIRDMQPITGGCHYFHGCEQWKRDCKGCPQLVNNWGDFPAKVIAAKRQGYRFDNLTLVALSDHTADILRHAPEFCDCRIEVIPNSIEINKFRSPGRQLARQRLGLPQDRKIIGYVPSFSSTVKGFREVVVALEKLKNDFAELDPLVLLVGNKTPATDAITLEKANLGYISDNRNLALAYSAANVVVVPSLEETFSNTTAESISCGTPVVGFQTGAIHWMVADGVTGYTYSPGDTAGLAHGLAEVLTGPDLTDNCRSFASENLPLRLQGERYEDLYLDLTLSRAARRGGRMCDALANTKEEMSMTIERILQDRAG